MTHTARRQCAAIIVANDLDRAFYSAQPRWAHTLLGQRLLDYPIDLAQGLGCERVRVVARTATCRAMQSSTSQDVEWIATQGSSLDAALREGLKGLPRAVDEIVLLPGDAVLLQAESLLRLLALREREGCRLALLSSLRQAQRGLHVIERDESGALVAARNLRSDVETVVEADSGVWLGERRALQQIFARRAGSPLGRAMSSMGPGAVGVETVPLAETLRVVDRVDLGLATRLLRAAINQQHMLAGVTLYDPATTLIEPSVEIAADTCIGSHVELRGATQVGAGARIDSSVIVIDSHVEDGAHVRSFSHLEQARVRSSAIVGPFTRLRPLADIGPGAHVGNFVEVKKTVIEAGAKANHLAYLGDARVGSGANIGAGTITCNYDGSAKHRTDIGRGVFVGSNSTLVAPIQLQDGAYVAAGSTLTRDVPGDALAFGRARQSIKPELARKMRARIKARAAARKGEKNG